MRLPEIDCPCGGREDDVGQPIPRHCHACDQHTMGAFGRRSRPNVNIARPVVTQNRAQIRERDANVNIATTENQFNLL